MHYNSRKNDILDKIQKLNGQFKTAWRYKRIYHMESNLRIYSDICSF